MGLDDSSQISMVCRVNDGTSITVYEDEPLILSVSMVNDAAVEAASHNSALEDQLQELERRFNAKQIREEQFKRQAEEIKREIMKVRIYRFGGPMGWPNFIKFQVPSNDSWRDVDWPLWLLIHIPAGQVVNLNGLTSCYVEFGLDPENPQRPEGEFQVKAIVEIVKGETVESDVATVNFLKQKMPEAERNKEENLLAKGRYFYKRGLYDDAKKYVQRILKANPHSIKSLDLLGDIEQRGGNPSAALSTYERALEEIRKQHPSMREPPRALISKINRLRDLTEEEQ